MILDIFPTVAAAAAAALPAGRKLDGVNILPALSGDTPAPPHDRLFWHTGGGTSFAVREGRYKLLRQGTPQPQIFDLAADPVEAIDVAGAKPDVARQLEAASGVERRTDRPTLGQPPAGGHQESRRQESRQKGIGEKSPPLSPRAPSLRGRGFLNACEVKSW